MQHKEFHRECNLRRGGYSLRVMATSVLLQAGVDPTQGELLFG
ncbi:MAG TPA: hypothetical protein VFF29_05380 [Bacteroidota bacterium]|nr:hypothetical protein [Bacteroidota bacterium]